MKAKLDEKSWKYTDLLSKHEEKVIVLERTADCLAQEQAACEKMREALKAARQDCVNQQVITAGLQDSLKQMDVAFTTEMGRTKLLQNKLRYVESNQYAVVLIDGDGMIVRKNHLILPHTNSS